MTQLFSRYVSKDVFDQVLANPELAELGGRRRTMSVLFSDMRGFTAMTERGDPEALVAQLNEYFSRMVEVVFAHHGTIDKFVGDMVMALFGAPVDDPDHADHAVATAVEMVRALEVLNARWVQEGRPALGIGIGVNSGEMIAGNIGSASIRSYTVIGDAVNLGARLESLNKEHGTTIIISAATAAQLKTPPPMRPLGSVVVKGKSVSVDIFEVLVDGVRAGRPARAGLVPLPHRADSTGREVYAEMKGAMKGLTIRFLLALAGCGVLATPAAAQFGSIGKGLSVAKKANDAVYTEAEKQQLGAEVSANIRKKFGVVQDESVHRYVTLVGAVLARVSKKPDYPWRFIVLDTDAVNAFAAPGGYIHITKGCLALIANESELAGVLGHELVHVIEDHTVKALSKAGFVDTAASASGKGDGISSALVSQVTNIALQGFGRGEELESDQRRPRPRGQGRLPAGRAAHVPAAADRSQQELQREARPVRLAPGDAGAARQARRAGEEGARQHGDARSALPAVHQLQAGAAVADRDGRGGRVGPGVGQLQQRQEDRRRRTRTRRRTPRRPRRSPRRRASAWAASPAASAAARRSRARRSPRVARAGSIPKSTPRAARTRASSASA